MNDDSTFSFIKALSLSQIAYAATPSLTEELLKYLR